MLGLAMASLDGILMPLTISFAVAVTAALAGTGVGAVAAPALGLLVALAVKVGIAVALTYLGGALFWKDFRSGALWQKLWTGGDLAGGGLRLGGESAANTFYDAKQPPLRRRARLPGARQHRHRGSAAPVDLRRQPHVTDLTVEYVPSPVRLNAGGGTRGSGLLADEKRSLESGAVVMKKQTSKKLGTVALSGFGAALSLIAGNLAEAQVMTIKRPKLTTVTAAAQTAALGSKVFYDKATLCKPKSTKCLLGKSYVKRLSGADKRKLRVLISLGVQTDIKDACLVC